ncbi:MAG: hypothetical protein Fur0032_06040 [Terrimicrobiaceae bacterium]
MHRTVSFTSLLLATHLCAGYSQLTFDPSNLPTASNPPTEEYWDYTGTYAHQKGAKALLLIRVQGNNKPWTNPPAESTYTSALTNLSKRYYDSSGHQTWVGPKKLGTASNPGHSLPGIHITPIVTLPNPAEYYTSDTFWELRTHSIAAVRALGGEYAEGQRLDPENFDRIMVTSNHKMISSEGLAYVGGDFSWPGGAYEHELGHNWGLMHANFWDTPTGSKLSRDPDGTSIEYGDGSDVMGGGNTLFHEMFKNSNLGWLEDSRGEAIKIAASGSPGSGTYRLYSHGQGFIRNETTKLRAIKFDLPQTTWLGYRYEALGATDGGDNRASRDRHALQIRRGNNFLDTTPDSRLDDDKIDGSIKIGRTYSEFATDYPGHSLGGIHITPIARGVTSSGNTPAGDHYYIDVVINRGSDVPSNNAAPTASFAAPTVSASVGTPVSLSVTASDPDGDSLAYDWDFGNGAYNITNSASQSPTYASAGLYLVRCTVSDMKGQTTTVRQWVNVGAQPTQPATSEPSTSGLHYRVYSGTWTTMPDFDTLNPIASGTSTGFDLSLKPSNDNFALLFTGFIDVPITDTYQFTVTSDDGARLIIDGQTVFDNDGVKTAALSKSGNIALEAGRHPIRLEYFHKDGAETLQVQWWRLGQSTPETIPASVLVQPTWAGNAAPTVALTAPAHNSDVLVNSDVILSASASDDGSIAKVVFFANGSYLAADTTAPYSYTWPKVSVGSKNLTAIAYDATGRWTHSASVTIQVVSPPPTNGIGINLGADTTKPETMLYANERVGAVYDYANWNNITGVTSNVTYALTDHNNNSIATTLKTDSSGARSGRFETAANTSTAAGKLMRGVVRRDFDIEPSPRPDPWVEVADIPYASYDVYVYVDLPENHGNDDDPQRILLTPSEGVAPAARFLKSSVTVNDGTGDFPTYDTWSGFREATAESRTASNDSLFGNYVVFRNQTASSFLVESTRNGDPTLDNNKGRHARFLSAIQIMESVPSAPTLVFRHTGSSTAVTEAGVTDTVTVALAYPPTGNVTVNLDPGTQLALDQTALTFTPADWSAGRAVTVRAIDDSTAEGPHTASLTATANGANYTGIPVRTLNVAITDNDQAIVSVHAIGTPKEGSSPTAATFRFIRSGQASLGTPVTVNFTINGTAVTSDFTLSGTSANFDPGTAAGSVAIPAGAATVELTLTPVNDANNEGLETVILTLTDSASAAIGTPASATLAIADDDRIDYFTQYFGTTFPSYGIDEYYTDLDNTTITLTPDGSPSHYSATVTRGVTAYPTSVTGHINLRTTTKTYADTNGDGYWAVNSPATFYGTTYNTIYVRANGAVSFDLPESKSFGSGSNRYTIDLRSGYYTYSASLNNFFAARQLALYRMYLDSTTGNTYVGRVTTPGQERTVVTYDNVGYFYDTNEKVKAQVEFWDNGKITMTWLGGHAANQHLQVTGLSNVALDANSVPATFYESNLSAYTEISTSSAPVFATIPSLAAAVGSSYTYTAATTSHDGSTPAISAVTKPAWLTFTDHGNGTATLSGSPSASGTHTVTLRATAGSFSTDQTYTLIVAPVGQNTAPAFISSPVTQANQGQVYTYSISATDADGQSLSLTSATLPGWLTLTDHGNGTATLSGTGPSADLATYNVVLLASDGSTATPQSFTITVNKAPSVTLSMPMHGSAVLTDRENTLALAATASDDGLPASPGIHTASWSTVSGPAPAIFADASALTTSAAFPQAGIYRLRLSVTDGTLTTTRDVVAYVETAASSALASGLIGHWKFDETSGTTAADSSGTGNDLTLTGAVTFGTGIEGNAYVGTASNAQFGEKAGLTQPVQFTTSCWIRPATAPADGGSARYLLAFRQGSNTRGYLAVPSGSRQLQFRSSHSTQGVWNVTGYDLPANEWVHVAVSYDQSSTANDPAVYINGQPVTVVRSTAPSGSINTTDALRIGGTGNTAQSWRGSIDDVRLYNRILTADEAAFLPLTTTPNTAPVVRASLRDPLLTGQNSAVLIGTATDDGLPVSPGALTTSWTQVSGPATAAIASPNETQTSVTFPASGTYVFAFSASDDELATTATLTAEAQLAAAEATSIIITPASVTVLPSATTPFSASVLDQYGQPMSGQTITWAVSGGGVIDSAGVFTAGATEGGPNTVTATSGALYSTAQVTVFNSPPTISDIADQVVTQGVSTGALTFTVGDTETAAASLVVTATSSNQTLVPNANLALGGSAANRSLVVTPATNQSGTATVSVTVSDGAKSATDSFLLTVQAGVVTSIEVTPATATLQPTGSLQFTAIVKDQNGAAMNPQPTVTWSATGTGSVNSTGLFTAGGSTGSGTVTATVNSVSGSATVTVANTAPTVTITSPSQSAMAMPDGDNSLVLTATASDAQVTPTVTWTQVSGPAGGTATFANANTANTSVSFSAIGEYVLRITASDSLLTATDEVTIHVGTSGGLGPVSAYLGTNFLSGVTSGSADSLRFSGDNADKTVAFTGGGSNTASPMWTVANATKVDFKQIDSVTYNGFTWGQSSDPIRYGSVFTTGTDFGYVIGSSNSNIRYSGTTATEPLVQFGAGAPASGAFNFVFEIKGGEVLGNLTVKYKAGTASTSGAWHTTNTAANNGNYNVSVHPLDGSGNAGAGFTFYATDQALGAGGGIAVTATDQGANSLSAGTYLLRILFFDKTKTERYSIDDVSIEGSTGLPAGPQVNPGPAPAATVGEAATLSGTASTNAAWTLISGPGTATFANASSASTTVTFQTSGTYVLRLSATDGTATVFEDLTVIATGETFASWIAGEPGVGTLTSANADPDADGLPNLVEYALGGAAGSPDSSILPAVETSADHLTLTFTPMVTQGLRYIIEASSDLSDWSEQTDITSLLTPGQPYTHTDSSTFTNRRFLRLKVTEEP